MPDRCWFATALIYRQDCRFEVAGLKTPVPVPTVPCGDGSVLNGPDSTAGGRGEQARAMGAMDELINPAAVRSLAVLLLPGKDALHLARAGRSLNGLKLRARTDLVAEAMLADLPRDYRKVARIIRRALKSPQFTGWMIWPVTETVTTLALEAGDFEDGLLLLSELTPRLTGEFAIRRFLAADLPRSLLTIIPWTSNPDPHVRRLASEGTRSFLPWSVRVKALLDAPESTRPVIDALHDDESDYVRRSVANHLNDLSRLTPDLAVAIAADWLADGSSNTRAVVRHGLRSLVKKAHPGALALMGFAPAQLTVHAPRLVSDIVTTPGELIFEFDVTNNDSRTVTLAIDYVVHYVKSNGARNEKVFKLATKVVGPAQTVRLTKKHAFRQMTTRVHYAGEHLLELQINGQRHTSTAFLLEL